MVLELEMPAFMVEYAQIVLFILRYIRSLCEMMDSLRKSHVVMETFQFYVRRDNVVNDALKRTLKPLFAPNKQVMVSTFCTSVASIIYTF